MIFRCLASKPLRRMTVAGCLALSVGPLAPFRGLANESADDHAASGEEKVDADKPKETTPGEEHAEAKPDAEKDQKEKAKPKAKADKSDDKDKDEKADKEKSKDDKDKSKDKEKSEEPKPTVTHGTATIDGKDVAYTATAGKMLLETDDGEAKARVFFVAYTKDEPGDLSKRPITYCFNGGPGSSSVWLHLGMLGPKRVKLDSDAKPLRPPHEIIANPYSMLDKTDLVFIDPVSTGYSRPAKGEDKRQFHGYEEDVRSVGQFIHDYTSKYNRWSSPKFIIGESYGGLRAAGLSGELQERYRLYLNGIVLVSSVVDFQTLVADGHNDIAYVLFLPSYATTAWYHKALSPDMQGKSVEEVLAAAEEFAAGPYLHALEAGDGLPAEERAKVVKRMAELTGLSPEYIEDSNLRVIMPRFGKELLRKLGLIVGRFDSRYTGPSLDRVGDATDYDPSGSAVYGAFTSAMNDYLRTTLKVEENRVYEILTDNVQPWDYKPFTNRFVDASETLREAMTENPYLKVYAACGYYDLATPEFAMKYTRDHLNLAPALRGNFTIGHYEGGHMMYAREQSLAKLRDELVKFYEQTLSASLPAAP